MLVSAPPSPRSESTSASREVHLAPLVRVSDVALLWAPLALSWLVMALELPLISAVLARLPNPEIHLGAYGGVALPIALIVEAPIMMLLAASTALAKDLAAFRLIYRFMMLAGGALTVIHALLAFTPLFDLVIVQLIGPPPELIEPSRTALQWLLPFSWAIGYRRFHQGALIRFGFARYVTIGTVVRIVTLCITLLALAATGAQGVVAAAGAMIAGVVAEAVFIDIVARPVVRSNLTPDTLGAASLTWAAFSRFYAPLVLTMLVSMLSQPLGSAALSRMPEALASLAVLPAVSGLLFLLRSVGIAYAEVVIALLDRPGAGRALTRFTLTLAASLFVISVLMAFTPFSRLWFAGVSGLSPELAQLASLGVAAAIFWPSLDTLRSALQGRLTHMRNTAHVGEATVVFIVTSAALLAIGVLWQGMPGLPYAMAAFSLATLVQLGWLAWRSGTHLRSAAAKTG